MTANQIANASVNEAIRHNIVSEEEIQRHNLAVESLEQDKLQLNQWIETQRLDLQKAYNEAVLNNDSYALEIKKQLADAEVWYNQQMVDIKNREKWIAEDWNAIQEELGLINARLKDKEIEYQKTINLESNQIKWEDLNLRREYQENQIYIGLENLSLNRDQFTLAQNTFDMNYLKLQQNYKVELDKLLLQNQIFGLEMTKWQDQQRLLESQEFSNYLNAFSNSINSWSNLGSKLINLGF